MHPCPPPSPGYQAPCDWTEGTLLVKGLGATDIKYSCEVVQNAQGYTGWPGRVEGRKYRRGGGGWHKASVSDCLPLAAPIGLSPLLILTLCGPERVLVVSTEPPDDLSCLTTPGVGRPGDEGGGGGFGAGENTNLQILARRNLCHFLKMSEHIVSVSRYLPMRNSGRWQCLTYTPPPPAACDIPSGCCSFTGPWTVTRSSLRMLRRVAAFCRPLRPVLLLVSFPRSRSPVVDVPGLC